MQNIPKKDSFRQALAALTKLEFNLKQIDAEVKDTRKALEDIKEMF